MTASNSGSRRETSFLFVANYAGGRVGNVSVLPLDAGELPGPVLARDDVGLTTMPHLFQHGSFGTVCLCPSQRWFCGAIYV